MSSPSVKSADKSKPYIPERMSNTSDGFSDSKTASATCYCGSVQLSFDLEGVSEPFVCNCTDCHKLHGAVLGTNFVVSDEHIRYVRGEDKISTFAMTKTIGTPGATMTNYFCKECGSLMYRVGTSFPGNKVMRIGIVDDFNLMETLLKPKVEQYTKDRVSWLPGVDGAKQVEGSHYHGKL